MIRSPGCAALIADCMLPPAGTVIVAALVVDVKEIAVKKMDNEHKTNVLPTRTPKNMMLNLR
jgi:hypothetical protein